MRLIDTCAWIEWLIGSPPGAAVQRLLPARESWVVPTIVQLELTKWLVREVGRDAADRVLAFTQMCPVIPLDTEIAVRAAELCASHKLATADAIVYATALQTGAELVTCDSGFASLPQVMFVDKTKP